MICPFNYNQINPYRIYELYPRGGMSGAGFNVYLHHDIANKIKTIKIKDLKTNHIIDVAKGILKNLGFYEHNGLFFYEDTLLLHWCRVDGSACEIGVDGNDIGQEVYDEPLAYTPHNVDTPLQAYGLLSLWLHWFKYAELLINHKK